MPMTRYGACVGRPRRVGLRRTAAERRRRECGRQRIAARLQEAHLPRLLRARSAAARRTGAATAPARRPRSSHSRERRRAPRSRPPARPARSFSACAMARLPIAACLLARRAPARSGRRTGSRAARGRRARRRLRAGFAPLATQLRGELGAAVLAPRQHPRWRRWRAAAAALRGPRWRVARRTRRLRIG